jgi:hypothetical protein
LDSVILADWISTVRDLGLPTLLGVALGSVVTAWLEAKGRRTEHELTIERIILQERRGAASVTDEALARLEIRTFQGPDTASDLRNEWITQVRPKALLIDDEELARRVELVGQLLSLAHQLGRDKNWRNVAGTCIADARNWLRAFLRRVPPTPAVLGPYEQILASARQHGERNIFDILNAELLFRESGVASHTP